MKSKYLKNMPMNLAIIAILIFITFKYLITGFSSQDIKDAYNISQKSYLVVAMLFAILYMFCEAKNTKRLLNSFGYDAKIFQTVRYAFTGFFFAGLTPSATGGQPVEIFVMKKEGIKISHSSLVLMLELCSFQLATVIMALVGFYYNFDYIMNGDNIYTYVIFFGIIINFLIFLFIFFAIFSKRFLKYIKGICYFFIDKLKFIKDKDKKKKLVDSGLDDYRYSSIYVKSNKLIAFKTLVTSFIQVSILYSISYIVYRALGYEELSFFSVFFLQALAFVSVSAMPLPGAIGISEKVFNFLFLPTYGKLLNEGLILTRGINFYFLFSVSALVFFVSYNKYVFGRNKVNGKA